MQLFQPPETYIRPGAYEPAVDGLRFCAFALVLVNHGPALANTPWLFHLHEYAWVGVEIFFSISAYLLTSHLLAESEQHSRIDIRRFYWRRVLRIYPLLFTYTLAMLLIFGPSQDGWLLRLIGTLGLFDNWLTWNGEYAGHSIRGLGHLWTLSFEAQFYIALPLIVLLYRRVGIWGFTGFVAAIVITAAVARALLFDIGVPHPVVYTIPVFRPESLLMGTLLAIIRPTWHWKWSFVSAVCAWAAFLSLPLPWTDREAAVYQYVILGFLSASTLDVVLRCHTANRILAWRPLVALGVISYGLYVFHVMVLYAIQTAAAGTPILAWATTNVIACGAYLVAVLGGTVMVATLSYRYLELPFLKRKRPTNALWAT